VRTAIGKNRQNGLETHIRTVTFQYVKSTRSARNTRQHYSES